MKRLSVVFFLSFAFAAPAQSEGALAVAIHDGGMRKGFAYAWHVRAVTKEEAEKEALAACRLQAQMNGVPPSKCKITEVFRNRCIAAAFDPQTRRAAWGIGGDEAAARTVAINKCGGKSSACHISDLDCDK
jgi:hypothetical protein